MAYDDRAVYFAMVCMDPNVDALVARFDHVDLKRVPPFENIKPTAANLARTVFELAAAELQQGITTDRVELGESEKQRVEYQAA